VAAGTVTDLLDGVAAVLLLGVLAPPGPSPCWSSTPSPRGPSGGPSLGGEDEPGWNRALFAAVTGLRQVTTRLPYPAVHAVSWVVAAVASTLFLWPRRLLRRWAWGDRLTRHLPLVHYTDVPFRMVVSEQFDRLVAPIEGRFSRQDVEAWLRDVGFEVVAILPGLGWRAIGRRPAASRS
jgi:hypothetical protein